MPTKLIRTIQLLHPFDSASEAEFLKEFFRFVGCLVYDRPLAHTWNAESISQSDVVIFLNYPVEGHYALSSGSKCVYIRFSFSSQDQSIYQWEMIAEKEFAQRHKFTACCKADLESQVLDQLIAQIWKDSPLDAECLQGVRNLYLANNLYPILQYKRALRVLRMGEAIDANISINKITPEPFIVEMLRSFWRLYAVLRKNQRLSCREPVSRETEQDGRSVYGIYACANAGRSLRQVYFLLRYPPDENLDCNPLPEGLSPEEARFTLCDAQTLVEHLKFILAKDSSFLAAYLLAATISKTSRELEFAVREYYSYILMRTHPSDIYYAFIQYELGNYYEKIGGDIGTALQYFQQALAQDNSCYQAQYKVSCYDARAGRFQEAELGFMRVIKILFCGKDSDDTESWEQLSLKRVQYAFKSYIWLAKIAYNYYRNTAMVVQWIGKAFQAAKMYQASWLLRRSVTFAGGQNQENPHEVAINQEWIDLQNYHQHSEPMHVLWLVLRFWVDGVIQDAYLQTLVQRELQAFEASADN